MKKTRFILIFFITSSLMSVLKAQTKSFELIMPDVIVSNNLYDKLEYLDNREFKENFGYVQTSMLNNQKWMVEDILLSQQLDDIMDKCIDRKSTGRTMLFQLRNLYFSEITKAASEVGHCHIRISLFEKGAGEYYHINTLDTLVEVKAMDVTGKLIKSASASITTFLLDNLSQNPIEEQPYLLTDVRNIDYYEKDNLKLYSTDIYNDGIYFNFDSFVAQRPDVKRFTPEFKKGELKVIKALCENGKSSKLSPKEVYAVVVDGYPYVSSKKSYIQLYKENNEFRFVNDGNVKVNLGASIGAGVAAGLSASLFGVGVFVIPQNKAERVVMQIDHLNGSFVMTHQRTE